MKVGVMADKDRLLREAQKIGAKFQFFSVGGNMAHLLGYVHEAAGVKYQVEIKYDDNFPTTPPQLIFSRPILNLLGSEISLSNLESWTEDSEVVAIIEELRDKVLETIQQGATAAPATKMPTPKPAQARPPAKPQATPEPASPPPQEEQWVTPDMGSYPDGEVPTTPEEEGTPTWEEGLTGEEPPQDNFYEPSTEEQGSVPPEAGTEESTKSGAKEAPAPEEPSIAYNEDETPTATEQMALILQEYSADAYGPGRAQIYMTITVEQTFILKIEFNNYPARPEVILPPSIKTFLGDLTQGLKILREWSDKKPPNIVDVVREIERKLYSLKDIEAQAKGIMGEYKVEKKGAAMSNLHVHLLTFGFKDYTLDVDLTPYPNAPEITFSPELASLVKVTSQDLDNLKNWKPKESEVVGILREVSWLVDKNSRLKFEVELLESGLKDVAFNPEMQEIHIKMKGEMKTKDVTFDFKATIPPDYPSIAPKVELVSKLEEMDSVKEGINKSLKQFFSSWSNFSFLIDLFNSISKTIFNVSTLTCILCHKLECPSCQQKIAAQEGEESCHARCPHCERDYHDHCWQQTISSFGKCGFCLRSP